MSKLTPIIEILRQKEIIKAIAEGKLCIEYKFTVRPDNWNGVIPYLSLTPSLKAIERV